MKRIAAVMFLFVLFMTWGIVAYAGNAGIEEVNETAIADGILAGEYEDEIKELISFIKNKLENGELETAGDIKTAIREGEEKFDISLSDEEKEKILQTVQKIKELAPDSEEIADKVKELYGTLGEELINDAGQVIKKSFKESVSNFFTDMGTTVKNFFANIFS